MKISSWNVNSVRARIVNITNYIKTSQPDILLIQEIKTEKEKFPFKDFKKLGYDCHVYGQKSYNGVAFVTKININKIVSLLQSIVEIFLLEVITYYMCNNNLISC